MAFDDLKLLGSEKAVKAASKIRLEGKDYIVRDGDIINFRFNVCSSAPCKCSLDYFGG